MKMIRSNKNTVIFQENKFLKQGICPDSEGWNGRKKKQRVETGNQRRAILRAPAQTPFTQGHSLCLCAHLRGSAGKCPRDTISPEGLPEVRHNRPEHRSRWHGNLRCTTDQQPRRDDLYNPSANGLFHWDPRK